MCYRFFSVNKNVCEMLECYDKLQPKPKTVLEFKDALTLYIFIWSATPEKAMDNAVRPPQATVGMCVSQ